MSSDAKRNNTPLNSLETLSINSPDDVINLLRTENYICERGLATALLLSLRLRRPLFLEGEPGIGKTELAKVVANSLNRDFLRLQCYEGLDIATSVYEWNYPRQMAAIRLSESTLEPDQHLIDGVFSKDFLIKRPLLKALEHSDKGAPVLLVDELDRADAPFEAYLLELMSDFEVTVPEIGTFRTDEPPIIIVTSNRTREVHDALRRRCIYHWIDYPTEHQELEILQARIPDIPERVSRELVAFIQILRQQDLFKAPGIAETLDFASALVELDETELNSATLKDMLGTLVKYRDDLTKIQKGDLDTWVEDARRLSIAKEL
ncbi:MAG: AAA family ATPase [Gammaproteobacteria bacterium]|nr:MAG: AAA family ATPase [Gammaproteobacteria bacterium]